MSGAGRPRWRRRLAGVAGLVLGSAMVVAAVWSGISHLVLVGDLEDRGVVTTATTEDTARADRRGGPDVTVSFRTEGGRVRHELHGDDDDLGPDGATVLVRFDPQDPSRVVVADRMSRSHLLPSRLAVLLTGAVIVMAGWSELRRDASRRGG